MIRVVGGICAISAVGALVATEILREVVNRRRVREHGIGGTQDIAFWGMLVASAFLLAALTCFGMAAFR
jgi:hypothetical protein